MYPKLHFCIPIISLNALHQVYYTFNDFLIHLKRPALNNHIHTIINISVFPIGIILTRVFNRASIPFASRLLHQSWNFHRYSSRLRKLIILWPVLYLFWIAIHNISKRIFIFYNQKYWSRLLKYDIICGQFSLYMLIEITYFVIPSPISIHILISKYS